MTSRNSTHPSGMRRSPKAGRANNLWIPDATVSTLNERPEAPADRSSLVAMAKRIKEIRAVRSVVFAPELFGEPAWDLLLALYIAEGDQYRLNVTAACMQSNIPETTALRWLTSLGEAGLIKYTANPTDARSRYVSLSSAGVAMMDRVLKLASSSV
jgi:DNA-binding MarR family transcriptional regulator